ncbi:hypothetical protein [Burkholderia sp. LMG 21824]|uniref:hypothetical protein n=1 Tax=Burkholderia sp. LMG 21824 TaxID=3158172 RepID=UPI003C2F9229
MKLYNFDHGCSKPTTIRIGPYRIEIAASHCTNLAGMPQRAKQMYMYDGQLRRVVVHVPRERGGFVETAVANRDGSEEQSRLFPDISGISQDYDLVLLLSFLTGRRVYIDQDLEGDPRRAYGDSVIDPIFLQYLPPQIWISLDTIAKIGLSDALNCMVNAAHAPDLIGRGAYANAAFDAVCSAWAKKSNKTKYESRPLIERAALRVVGEIEKTILAKSRDLILKIFQIEGVAPNVAEDISARFRSTASPSAVMKMTCFLQKFDLFPLEPSGEQNDRLKWLNTVRNGIAHSGAIRTEKTLGAETSLSVAGAVVILTEQIVAFYLACEILNIRNPSIESIRNEIREFFFEGTFRKQRVFTESYGEYLDRLENEWVQGGVV